LFVLSNGDRLASAEKGGLRRSAQYDAWQTIHPLCHSNGVYVWACSERVGLEHGDVRGNTSKDRALSSGEDRSCRSFGRIIAKAAHDKEEILVGAKSTCACWKDTRRNWPFLRDRRIDALFTDRASLPRWVPR